MAFITDYYNNDWNLSDIIGIKESYVIADGAYNIAYLAVLSNHEEIRIHESVYNVLEKKKTIQVFEAEIPDEDDE